MRIKLLFPIVLLIGHLSYSQEISLEYLDRLTKAKNLYDKEEYKKAAIAYSDILPLTSGQFFLEDHYWAAASWALANCPDSAFKMLNIIVQSPWLTFRDYTYILFDPDFDTLQNDSRWKDTKERFILNAFNTYATSLSDAMGEKTIPALNASEIAEALYNEDDELLSKLNNPAFGLISDKKYNKAYRYIRASIDQLDPNEYLYKQMGDYYHAVNDIERAFTYYARSLNKKFRDPMLLENKSIIPDSLLKVEYSALGKKTGRNMLPPDYLLLAIENTLFTKGRIEEARFIAELNEKYWPESNRSALGLSNYYRRKGDKPKADSYLIKSILLQYQLPASFLDPAFNTEAFIRTRLRPFFTSLTGRVMRPQDLVNVVGQQLLAQKIYDKAELLFTINMSSFPLEEMMLNSMVQLYRNKGIKEKEKEYDLQLQSLNKDRRVVRDARRGPIFDSTFNTQVLIPVCTENCPIILFDGAHKNHHTGDGRYKTLSNLMKSDGFNVINNKLPFNKQSLSKAAMVVIAAPQYMDKEELNELNKWVHEGGSLLTVTDHSNFNFDGLLESFGIQAPETEFTEDPNHPRIYPDGINKNPRNIVFTRDEKLLGEHPILQGRNSAEEIKLVKTFSGRTIIAPSGSTVLLKVAESAIDYLTIEPSIRTVGSSVAVKCNGNRAYGVAINFGKGKVVVLSEAAMLTAQLWPPDWAASSGMNVPGSDNKQFALNIIRWLTGYLR